jgi:hypothetical protein
LPSPKGQVFQGAALQGQRPWGRAKKTGVAGAQRAWGRDVGADWRGRQNTEPRSSCELWEEVPVIDQMSSGPEASVHCQRTTGCGILLLTKKIYRSGRHVGAHL